MTKDKITSEIINLQQCTIEETSKMVLELKNLGLEYCKKFNESEVVYDLMEFAFLRKYILPNDSFVAIVNSLSILEMHHKEQMKNLEKRFKEKHGTKENWTDQILEELAKEKIPLKEKRAEDLSKMVIETFEKISDQESVKNT